MSFDRLNEVYRQFRAAQDKYAYFLLTVAGACIALTINQTNNARFTLHQIPLGLAALMWAASFISGCRHISYLTASLYNNYDLLKIELGEHPIISDKSHLKPVALEVIKSALEKQSSRASRYSKLQFIFLLTGALFYIFWHILCMWHRTFY